MSLGPLCGLYRLVSPTLGVLVPSVGLIPSRRMRGARIRGLGLMEHKIKFVDDALLEVAGQQLDWALVNDRNDGMVLCIRRSGRGLGDEEAARVLEAAWEGYRQLIESRPQGLSA